MRSSHAERVPYLQPLEGVVRFQQDQQHLVGARGIGRAARRGDDAVRLHGIGNDRCLALEGDLRPIVLDRGLAGTNVAAGLAFGGG
jgi:hypothetical protein